MLRVVTQKGKVIIDRTAVSSMSMSHSSVCAPIEAIFVVLKTGIKLRDRLRSDLSSDEMCLSKESVTQAKPGTENWFTPMLAVLVFVCTRLFRGKCASNVEKDVTEKVINSAVPRSRDLVHTASIH